VAWYEKTAPRLEPLKGQVVDAWPSCRHG